MNAGQSHLEHRIVEGYGLSRLIWQGRRRELCRSNAVLYRFDDPSLNGNAFVARQILDLVVVLAAVAAVVHQVRVALQGLG